VAEDSSWKIAQYYEHHGQHQKAIAAYQKFLHSYRNSAKAGDAMIAVAENHEYLGRWVDAMDAYTNYLNKFPKGPHVERAKEQITWIKTYRL
jgi:outer membrane protein assembly factor BamD (BamD/ComL family)